MVSPPLENAATPPALDLRGVEKHYALGDEHLEVLKGIDLQLQRGEMVAIMGPSGVGKSTLLNCIAGLDFADRGVLNVLGQDVTRFDDQARTLFRRRNIGIVYQFFNLVSNLTALENVQLPYLIEGVPPDSKAVNSAMERVGITKRAKHMPAQLSGGEMQLISIARAIVRRPGLVLADEPTGNVNVATGKRIMSVLRELIKEANSGLLMVTHNPEDAACADRIVFMKDGFLSKGSDLLGSQVSRQAIHDRLSLLQI